MYLVSFSGNIRSKCAQFADKRIRRVTEVIKNMRFIKMGVLETPLVNIINGKAYEWLLMKNLTFPFSGWCIFTSKTKTKNDRWV